jgi:hypothetical protein
MAVKYERSEENIQSLLGTKLRRTATEDDTVIIFYAGHGAVETDPLNSDGDGFGKYLSLGSRSAPREKREMQGEFVIGRIKK